MKEIDNRSKTSIINEEIHIQHIKYIHFLIIYSLTQDFYLNYI